MDAKLATLPLKQMDGLLLSQLILAKAGDAPALEGAVLFAAYYHRAQTRASRAGLPRTHYIEHPLRVCLRLMRWGVDNPTVLIAAVLHDVVEDCADEIEADYGKPAIDVIEGMFGTAVATTVDGLTNPPEAAGDTAATRAERNARYVAHVTEAIRDPFVLLVKFSDFTDNALSLHHHTHLDGMTQRLAQKYLSLVPVFDDALRMLELRGGHFAGVAHQMLRALWKNRLAELATA